jgi:hypothetical protein
LRREWKDYFDLRILMLSRPSYGIGKRIKRDNFTNDEQWQNVFEGQPPVVLQYLNDETPETDLVIAILGESISSESNEPQSKANTTDGGRKAVIQDAESASPAGITVRSRGTGC